MRHAATLLAVLVPVLLLSCVTPNDIRDVAFTVEKLEASLNDETQSLEQVQEQARETRESIKLVADRVEERTQGFLTGASAADVAAGGGVFSLLTGVLLNFYRNRRRQQRGEAV